MIWKLVGAARFIKPAPCTAAATPIPHSVPLNSYRSPYQRTTKTGSLLFEPRPKFYHIWVWIVRRFAFRRIFPLSGCLRSLSVCAAYQFQWDFWYSFLRSFGITLRMWFNSILWGDGLVIRSIIEYPHTSGVIFMEKYLSDEVRGDNNTFAKSPTSHGKFLK